MTTPSTLRHVLISHPGGALGDFVLLWPLIRVLRAGGAIVEVISAHSRARLAERVLGVRGTDINRAEWNTMWRGPHDGGPATRREVDLVVAVAVGEAWIDLAKQLFPSATIVVPEGILDRMAALALRDQFGPPTDVPRFEAEREPGTVVCHVGTGGGKKSWPLAHWLAVSEILEELGVRARLIAGEVERETWAAPLHAWFETIGGEVLGSIDALVDAIAPASVFVGCDTGPSHLAAQLAVPTLAIFGPTDPRLWAPIGPDVRVLAPPRPCAVEWLEPATVAGAITKMLPSPSRQ